MSDKFIFHTYGAANPVACAAARAVLRVIRKDNLIDNAKTVGSQLTEGLLQLKERYPIIGDLRGRGFKQAIELGKDRNTREPAPEATAAVLENTREQGLILSKYGTFKNVLRMVTPLCLSSDDVQPVMEALE